MIERTRKSLTLARIRTPYRPARSAVTIPTTQSVITRQVYRFLPKFVEPQDVRFVPNFRLSRWCLGCVWLLLSPSEYPYSMKIKVAYFSLTLAIIYRSTRRHVPEDRYNPIHFYVMRTENSTQRTKPTEGDFGEESNKPKGLSY